MKYVGLFCTLIILATVSCKSKKGIVREEKNETSRKTYHALSEKLNLEVTRGDNIELYTFISGWLGTPHQMGKCTKTGVDCSCFVRLAFDSVYHHKLPRTASEMHKHCKAISKEELREGDLVFFSIKDVKVSHVGLYLKNGWFAHVSTSKGVMINNLSEVYYTRYFTGAGRAI